MKRLRYKNLGNGKSQALLTDSTGRELRVLLHLETHTYSIFSGEEMLSTGFSKNKPSLLKEVKKALANLGVEMEKESRDTRRDVSVETGG